MNLKDTYHCYNDEKVIFIPCRRISNRLVHTTVVSNSNENVAFV